jgi:hypothetical protein
MWNIDHNVGVCVPLGKGDHYHNLDQEIPDLFSKTFDLM